MVKLFAKAVKNIITCSCRDDDSNDFEEELQNDDITQTNTLNNKNFHHKQEIDRKTPLLDVDDEKKCTTDEEINFNKKKIIEHGNQQRNLTIIGFKNRRNPAIMTTNEQKKLISSIVYEFFGLVINNDCLAIIYKYINPKWSWNTECSDIAVSSGGSTITNTTEGTSSWNNWAFSTVFPDTGVSELKIRIDKKRVDRGWLGLGVIRKSYVDTAAINEGGFNIYSKHAIFVDPSWNALEPHFGLKSLDVAKQAKMTVGDVISIIVNNTLRTIHFYLNEELIPFAEGDWSKLNYEPVCGYAILTTNSDQFKILTNDEFYGPK